MQIRETLLTTSSPFLKSSLSEMEQLLCTCNGFVYLAKEPFAAKIPPAKLAALDLSGTKQHVLLIVVVSAVGFGYQCWV